MRENARQSGWRRAVRRLPAILHGTIIILGSWYLLAWGQGVTVPGGSTLNVNTGTLSVSGEIDLDGTIVVTTGTVRLSGNYDNAGIFTAGTGTFDASGDSGTQTINTGGTGNDQDFYNFVHSGDGTAQFVSNNVDVDNDVTISGAGTLDANGFDMTVAGDWTQSGTAAFTDTQMDSTVTFDGTTQTISGSTSSFYNLTKIGNETLILEGNAQQTVAGTLTLMGTGVGTELTIQSDNSGVTQHQVFLADGALQDLEYLNVSDGNATNLDLIARNSNNVANNDTGGGSPEWVFGVATFTWDGDIDSDWETAGNWNVGAVPTSTDNVVIPDTSGGSGNYPSLATYSGAGVTVNNLTISSSAASLTLYGKNLTVNGTFSNEGTIHLFGYETVTLTNGIDIDSGTFNYQGDVDNLVDNFTVIDFGAQDYYNLSFVDSGSATVDNFLLGNPLTVLGGITVNGGTFDPSSSGNDLTVTGGVTINGASATLSSGSSSLDLGGSFNQSDGTFTAPTSTDSFTVAGDFTHSGGTFTAGTGTVTLDGTSQAFSADGTSFNNLSKITANGTLTVDSTVAATPTINGTLTIQGTSGNNLTITSDDGATQAPICLAAAGLQDIEFVDVDYSDAGPNAGCLLLIARGTGSSVGGNTNNWATTGTFTWEGDDGTTPTDWDTAANWDLGLVPSVDDTVILVDVASDPVLATDTQVENLTLVGSAILTLSGNDLTVDSTFENSGTISLIGTETVTITQDTNSGTFRYTGNNAGLTRTILDFGATDYYNLDINSTGGAPDDYDTNTDITVSASFTMTNGDFDLSAGGNTLTVDGTIDVDSGTFTGSNGNIDLNGEFDISGGTFIAPVTGQSFTVSGDWTNGGGTFTAGTGTVTFDDSTVTSTFSGDTTFNNFTSTAAGKTLLFGNGTNQTINGTITLDGNQTSEITLNVASLNDADQWSITPASSQSTQFLNVNNSDALTNTITCFNCTDGGTNNVNWLFQTLVIDIPLDTEVVDPTPTIIGRSDANASIEVKDSGNNTIATTTANSSGNWRVEVPNAIADGAETLQAFVGVNFGNVVNITVQSNPSTDDVPTITSHSDGDRVAGATPTITGKGLANQSVTIVAADQNGNLLQQTVGSGTVDGTGNYSITLTTDLVKGVNDVSVTVNGVASDIVSLSLTDPFGVVYDSVTGDPLVNAVVSLYRNSDDQLAQVGVDLDANDENPVTTGNDGFYSFIAADGDYYFTVELPGYTYPSEMSDVPAGRTVTTGSKGEMFSVAGVILEIDQPMDPSAGLLRIEKTANKGEVRVGEIVTYTVTIESQVDTPVSAVFIEDMIPPGFKYIEGRVTLDGVPRTDPGGQRPLKFNIGTVAPRATMTLKYQLVVGSGVTFGMYENSAVAKLNAGPAVSNVATEGVEVVPDPLFDMGNVLGKVFFDYNENGIQDPPVYDALARETLTEGPVPHVRIMMEDGTVVTTDKQGRFSVPGLLPGRHLFRLDERTLPPGTYVTTDKVVIVDVTQGLLSKVNFGVNVDQGRAFSDDEIFFKDKVRIDQQPERVVPRLNAGLFEDEILTFNGGFVHPAEFRIFTNYAPFIEKWALEVKDKDTNRLIRRFEGNRFNIQDPIFWDGRDMRGDIVSIDRQYEFTVAVYDGKDQFDTTKPQDIVFRDFNSETKLKEHIQSKRDPTTKQKRYQDWVSAEYQKSDLMVQTILVEGETLVFDRQDVNVRSIRIMRDNEYVVDVPVIEKSGLTAKEIMETRLNAVDDQKTPLDVILPKGEYQVVVQEVPGVTDPEIPLQTAGEDIPRAVYAAVEVVTPQARTYAKPIKVGEDYLTFVAMGDAKIGYTLTRGNIEPVRQNDQFRNGFWSEGKLAYYLKGKIKGKYLITSSFDTERDRKELFRNLDPDDYYPVYGDESTLNYDATGTQGPLYLLIEWDKSSVQWSSYAIDFNDTEFSRYSRTLYGGKIDLESLSTTKFGESKSKVVVYRARSQQRSAHNEFLSTGGSLYYLKHKDIIEGSESVKIEIRDKITGIVKSTKEMVEGADFELDYDSGRILFWQPVPMIVQSDTIISDDLLNGDNIYVVVDYEYDVVDKFDEDSFGARVRQALGDNLLIGGTYVLDQQDSKDYELAGTDVTLQLSEDAKITAEFAQTSSEAEGSFVSTDGGLSFTQISTEDGAEGIAYGISGDARLFNRIGLSAYYKWVEEDFSTSATTAQQGKEVAGFAGVFDINESTRVSIRQDNQRLIGGGNAQTESQVGANSTQTTIIQAISQIRKLKLTAEFQRQTSTEQKDEFDSETNSDSTTLAARAEYEINDRLTVGVSQQITVSGDEENNQTTIDMVARPNEHVTLRAAEVFGDQGFATTFGIESDLGKRSKLTENLTFLGEYSIIAENTGDIGTSGSIGAIAKVNESTEVLTTYGVQDAFGDQTRSLVLGGTSKIDDETSLTTDLTLSESLTDQTSTLTLGGTSRVDDQTTSTTDIKVTDSTKDGQSTSYTFGTNRKLTDEIELTSSRSFGVTDGDSRTTSNTYGLTRARDGTKLTGSLTRSNTDSPEEISRTNIFGLTGEIDNRWAFKGSFERGEVQNLDGTEAERNVLAFGVGYVKKDDETGEELLKSSTKVESRFDDGAEDRQQFLFYNATEGKLTPELTIFTKLEFSKTRNTTADFTEASYKEMVLGGAYRPIMHDRLNLLARYTYLEDQAPEGQVDTADIDSERAHIISAEAIYDLNDRWQISEKFAYRIAEERVAGFDFTKTHTWLMIHRLNYKINRDWMVGGEFRMLAVEEAKDMKSGVLVEAARRLGEFAQLGVGMNFTEFNDDLTALDYTAYGPFIRMTGKFYDRTEEEIARSRQKILDEKVFRWAWMMVDDELSRMESPIIQELNEYYVLASMAYTKGDIEESHRIYRDIIVAGQMMFDEAADYIQTQVEREQRLKEYQDMANDLFRQGQYGKAKKILEKVVVEAQNGMLE